MSDDDQKDADSNDTAAKDADAKSPGPEAGSGKAQGSGLTPHELAIRAGTPDASDSGRAPAVVNPGASEPKVVGMRRGAFGATQGGDTSGYAGLRRPIVIAGETQRPYGGYFDALADDLERALVGSSASFAEAVDTVVIDRGEMTITVRREHLPAVAQALRNDPRLRFEVCTGVSGVHYPDRVGEELHAVYHLLSITNHGKRVRVEVSCPDDDRHIPSIVSTYPANDWHERETWDMFGIEFDGHPALTRILMPDDWPGHPQRKDYPLGGIDVEYKGATIPPPDQRRSYN